MSRIASKPLIIPQGVTVTLANGNVAVEGPKGKMSRQVLESVDVKVSDKTVVVNRASDATADRMRQGTMFRLVSTMIEGVSKGYQKELHIEGVGFRAEVKGNRLVMLLGFTHPVELEIPQGITVKVNKLVDLAVEGVSKHQVGQFASVVRGAYEPEPYKGKGVRYLGETVRRKAGKAVVKQ